MASRLSPPLPQWPNASNQQVRGASAVRWLGGGGHWDWDWVLVVVVVGVMICRYMEFWLNREAGQRLWMEGSNLASAT